MTGHWTLAPGIKFEEKAAGFVYRITEIETGRYYIGKKCLTSRRKLRPLKGKKRSRRVEKESDWKTYTGSSEELNLLINEIGKEKFSFEIIRFCRTRAELNYFEAKEIFVSGALEQKEKSFNRWVFVRSYGLNS